MKCLSPKLVIKAVISENGNFFIIGGKVKNREGAHNVY
jgi:hypothetical protein